MFKMRLELVDAVAILVSIAVMLAYMTQQSPIQAAALLILVRLWRLAKIWQCECVDHFCCQLIICSDL